MIQWLVYKCTVERNLDVTNRVIVSLSLLTASTPLPMSEPPAYTSPPLQISVDTSMSFNFPDTRHDEEWDFNTGTTSELCLSSSESPVSTSESTPALLNSSASIPTASTSQLSAAVPAAITVALPPNYIPPSAVSSSRSRSPNHIPRPRNAFMIFRSSFLATQQLSTSIERDHRHISRIIAYCWNDMPAAEKASWRAAADTEKAAHAEKHPGYRFTPVGRAIKPIRRNVKRNGAGEMERCKQVAALILAGKKGGELEDAVRGISIPDDCDVAEAPAVTKETAKSGKKKGKRKAKSSSPPKLTISMPEENAVIVRGWAPASGSYEECQIPIFRDPLLAPAEPVRNPASPSPSGHLYQPYTVPRHVPRTNYHHDYVARSQSPTGYELAPIRTVPYEPSRTHSPSPYSPSHSIPSHYQGHYSPSPTGYQSPNGTPPYGLDYPPERQQSPRFSQSPTRHSLQQYAILEYPDRPATPTNNSLNLNPSSYNVYETPTQHRQYLPYQLPTPDAFHNMAPQAQPFSSENDNHKYDIGIVPSATVAPAPTQNPFFAEPYVPNRS